MINELIGAKVKEVFAKHPHLKLLKVGDNVYRRRKLKKGKSLDSIAIQILQSFKEPVGYPPFEPCEDHRVLFIHDQHIPHVINFIDLPDGVTGDDVAQVIVKAIDVRRALLRSA